VKREEGLWLPGWFTHHEPRITVCATMNRAWRQLVLLGFLSQGLTWGDYSLPLLYAGLWAGCVAWGQRRSAAAGRGQSRAERTPQPAAPGDSGRLQGEVAALEGLLLVGGCLAGYFLGAALNKGTHFFIGHGLVLVQAVRLARRLTRRELAVSFFIALFHIGVACTFLFDLRFLVVLLAAIVLIPKALMEVQAESFQGGAPGGARANVGGAPARLSSREPRGFQASWRRRPPAVAGGGWRLSGAAYGVVTATTVLFFLLFPRVFLRTPMVAPRGAGADSSTLLDSVLDPARSGLAQSRRVIFHVEGERLGYLRYLSLTEFDGVRWLAARPARKPLGEPPGPAASAYLHRRVRVKNALVLGRVLPTDGEVVAVQGRFFSRPMANVHGGVQADLVWNTANNVYDYWVDPQPKPEPLFRAQARACTACPAASARLRAWLDQTLAGATNSVAQARGLERLLRDNFTYQLGAPELNRLNPTEDFLLNQRTGHCERFASALAYLLRLQGIPSRVVIGFVASSRNLFAGGYNVRFKDAHAWTEAWFPERGWVQFDATPRGSLPPDRWSLLDLAADLDFAWASYVVSFDTPTQSWLLTTSLKTVSQIPGWARRHWEVWLAGGVGGLLWLLTRRLRGRAARPPTAPPSLRQQTIEQAEHYYGQMLRLLGRQGLHRAAHQTPLEFLGALAQQSFPALAEARLVTDLFCAMRYGNRPLATAQQAQVGRALASIQAASRRAAGAPGKGRTR
jgi:hypothetical protein